MLSIDYTRMTEIASVILIGVIGFVAIMLYLLKGGDDK